MIYGKSNKARRLIIVSNRLPFTVKMVESIPHFIESVGGVATGLKTYLESLKYIDENKFDCLWIGWPGVTIDAANQSSVEDRALREYSSLPVFLTDNEMENFYHGFCNKTIWPLFLYFPSFAEYKPEYWNQYISVNERFSAAIKSILKPDDIVWIHDYHLMLLPKMLKAEFPTVPIGFFLHIPFPSFEIFRLLPIRWRQELLEGLLGSDLIGFHTFEYKQHFLQCVLRILGLEHNMGQILLPTKLVKVETFPMGIDFKKFSGSYKLPDVVKEIGSLENIFHDVKVILSIDRLDYTKGIMNRLYGYELFLKRYPLYSEKVIFVMVVVPSRIDIQYNESLKRQIEETIGRLNGSLGTLHWRPIIYQFRSLPFPELAALYTRSDIALITPLRDGMNLIAKEYIACRRNQNGVLILSEMAGAAKELSDAIVINPNNTEEIAEAIYEALQMPEDEQNKRMQLMQHRIKRYDIMKWANEFLSQLIALRDDQIKFDAKIISTTDKKKIIENYGQCSKRLLIFDYDGTLTPFTRHPRLSRPSEKLLKILQTLSSDDKNTVVVISGRTRDTLQQWLGMLPIGLVGEHGIWLKEANSEWQILKDQPTHWKKDILPILENYADRLPGAFVEQKDYSLAWHYRNSDPEQGEIMARELVDHLISFTANINPQVLQMNKTIEVRNFGVNKGEATQYWLTKQDYDFILAIGDDKTDEDIFRVLPVSSYSIRVGIAASMANYNLRNQNDVIRFLEQLTLFTGKSNIDNTIL